MERGFQFDAVYTSKLKRAIRSSWIILRETGQMFRPAYATYRLNERMYGMLEGSHRPYLPPFSYSCVDNPPFHPIHRRIQGRRCM